MGTCHFKHQQIFDFDHNMLKRRGGVDMQGRGTTNDILPITATDDDAGTRKRSKTAATNSQSSINVSGLMSLTTHEWSASTRLSTQRDNNTKSDDNNTSQTCVYTTQDETYGFTPLHFACDDGVDIEKIKELVRACPKALEIESFLGFTPLDLILKNHRLQPEQNTPPPDEGIRFDANDTRTFRARMRGTTTSITTPSSEASTSLASLIEFLLQYYSSPVLRCKAGYMNCTFGAQSSHALASSRTIQEMDLSRVQLNRDGLIAFFQTLETSNTTLKDLTLNFFQDIDATVCQALQKMLSRNTTLVKLTLRVRLYHQRRRRRSQNSSPSVAHMIQTALENGLENNDTLHELNLEMVPQYKLYLLLAGGSRRESPFMSSSSLSFDQDEEDNDSNNGDNHTGNNNGGTGTLQQEEKQSQERIHREKIDMKLALNIAGAKRAMMDTRTTVVDFVEMMQTASPNLSAQYSLLRMLPHLWSNTNNTA